MSQPPTDSSRQEELVQKLFSEVRHVEKQLKDAARTPQSGSDERLQQLRDTFRDHCLKLLQLDLEFAAKHDIEASLWKHVFYKRIEEFRTALREHKEARSDRKSRGGGSSSSSNSSNAVIAPFRNFLIDARKFYEELLELNCKKARIARVGVAFVDLLGNDGVVQTDRSLRGLFVALCSCHHCLVYLGDLERYYQLNCVEHPSKRTWTRAERYYKQALQLLPDNGNPHNQLAVLASYEANDLAAVHRYFRSLAVRGQPFATARQNLKVIFDKNKQRVDALLTGNPAVPPSKADKASRTAQADNGVIVPITGEAVVKHVNTVKDLDVFIVKLYGMLYLGGGAPSTAAHELVHGGFFPLMHGVLYQIETRVLSKGGKHGRGESELVKSEVWRFMVNLLLGAIFCVHHSARRRAAPATEGKSKSAAAGGGGGADSAEAGDERGGGDEDSVLLSLTTSSPSTAKSSSSSSSRLAGGGGGPYTSAALAWLFRLMTQILQHGAEQNYRLLGTIVVFCDWLQLHRDVIHEQQAAAPPAHGNDDTKEEDTQLSSSGKNAQQLLDAATESGALATAQQEEQEARRKLWSGLATFVNRVNADKERFTRAVTGFSPSDSPVLPEELDFRGFAYLRDAYRHCGLDFAAARTPRAAPGAANNNGANNGASSSSSSSSNAQKHAYGSDGSAPQPREQYAWHQHKRMTKLLQFAQELAREHQLLYFNPLSGECTVKLPKSSPENRLPPFSSFLSSAAVAAAATTASSSSSSSSSTAAMPPPVASYAHVLANAGPSSSSFSAGAARTGKVPMGPGGAGPRMSGSSPSVPSLSSSQQPSLSLPHNAGGDADDELILFQPNLGGAGSSASSSAVLVAADSVLVSGSIGGGMLSSTATTASAATLGLVGRGGAGVSTLSSLHDHAPSSQHAATTVAAVDPSAMMTSNWPHTGVDDDPLPPANAPGAATSSSPSSAAVRSNGGVGAGAGAGVAGDDGKARSAWSWKPLGAQKNTTLFAGGLFGTNFVRQSSLDKDVAAIWDMQRQASPPLPPPSAASSSSSSSLAGLGAYTTPAAVAASATYSSMGHPLPSMGPSGAAAVGAPPASSFAHSVAGLAGLLSGGEHGPAGTDPSPGLWRPAAGGEASDELHQFHLSLQCQQQQFQQQQQQQQQFQQFQQQQQQQPSTLSAGAVPAGHSLSLEDFPSVSSPFYDDMDQGGEHISFPPPLTTPFFNSSASFTHLSPPPSTSPPPPLPAPTQIQQGVFYYDSPFGSPPPMPQATSGWLRPPQQQHHEGEGEPGMGMGMAGYGNSMQMMPRLPEQQPPQQSAGVQQHQQQHQQQQLLSPSHSLNNVPNYAHGSSFQPLQQQQQQQPPQASPQQLQDQLHYFHMQYQQMQRMYHAPPPPPQSSAPSSSSSSSSASAFDESTLRALQQNALPSPPPSTYYDTYRAPAPQQPQQQMGGWSTSTANHQQVQQQQQQHMLPPSYRAPQQEQNGQFPAQQQMDYLPMYQPLFGLGPQRPFHNQGGNPGSS